MGGDGGRCGEIEGGTGEWRGMVRIRRVHRWPSVIMLVRSRGRQKQKERIGKNIGA